MRQLAALVGLAWAAACLLAAYIFITSGLGPKAVAKGIGQQGPLISGGVLIAVFALFLVWQCVALAVSRSPKTEQGPTSVPLV